MSVADNRAPVSEDGVLSPLLLKSTKIVSTLGPSSDNETIIKQLIEHGVDVFRLNFSHGTQTEKAETIKLIRSVSSSLHRHVAIMADLQGPKHRLGELENHQSITLKNEQTIKFVSGELQPIGNSAAISTGTSHAHLLIKYLSVGHRVLINDGAVVLKVEQRLSEKELLCRVIVGGIVGERKGVNVPDLQVPTDALTDKDEEDAIFALGKDVEYIALSFVQKADDVIKLRNLLQKKLPSTNQQLPKIIAKIEKQQAIDVIDDIIAVVDGIMVARGDLGVECSFEKVPTFQKMLINKCNLAGKPVITATQMLESMINNPFPTRAEASDVANAVYDHTDAVMLSGETASGKYPVETVEAMRAIVVEAETNIHNDEVKSPQRLDYAIVKSAVAAATYGVHAAALILVCVSYDLGLYISKLRPPCPIIIVTFTSKLAQFLELNYGVHTIVLNHNLDKETTTDNLLITMEKEIENRKWLKKGDNFVFCCGEAGLPGLRNTLQLGKLGDLHVTHKERVDWKTLMERALIKERRK
ncbi:unnamed protein product [Didymodactylos carnosus]|uniref:Pyruvate kinase n=1 Tax=Didymodactylos carnosus TaxID=1234261 RepID=A0A8S2DE66_9BILA|nr:unnamed protein product [Didymodactylos carnosus]CAF3656184.1 unnamed protein product [Didymodactylos carnosus]